MKIYHYHPITKEYLGESFADESPLEFGVFLIPAHATDIEPPNSIEGKITVFSDGEWTQIIPEFVSEEPVPLTEDEKKAILRPIRNSLLDQADIKYCNADKWELMSEANKSAWRTWKQNMKDWVGVDLDNGTFPSMPV